MFIIVISFCWIEILLTYNTLFVSHNFDLSLLYDINTPSTDIMVTIYIKYHFHPFTLNFFIFDSKVNLLQTTYRWIIFSNSVLPISIWKVNPFTFELFPEKAGLTPAILLFIFHRNYSLFFCSIFPD